MPKSCLCLLGFCSLKWCSCSAFILVLFWTKWHHTHTFTLSCGFQRPPAPWLGAFRSLSRSPCTHAQCPKSACTEKPPTHKCHVRACLPSLCPQPPRAKFLRNLSKRSAKNAAKFWRNFSQIFVLQFPGKMAAKKNSRIFPRRFPRCTKLSFFFYCCNSGGLGACLPSLCQRPWLNKNSLQKRSTVNGGSCFFTYSWSFVAYSSASLLTVP